MLLIETLKRDDLNCPNCDRKLTYARGYVSCETGHYRGRVLGSEYLTFLFALEPVQEGDWTSRSDGKKLYLKGAFQEVNYEQEITKIGSYPRFVVQWDIFNGCAYTLCDFSPDIRLYNLSAESLHQYLFEIREQINLFVQEYFAGITKPLDRQ